jgi:hypothetical protein
MMKLTTVDEDVLEGVFLIFSDAEIDRIRNQNAAFVEPEDGVPWIIVANEDDENELEAQVENGDPEALMEWLRRGEEEDWPPQRLAKRREDYERETQTSQKPHDRVKYAPADFVDVDLTTPMSNATRHQFSVILSGSQLTNPVGLDILTKERADKLISSLITMRNRIWPEP